MPINVMAPASEEQKRDLRKKQCLAKHSYESRKQARTMAERAGADVGVKMTFYKCPFCRFFHLTKRRNSTRKQSM